MQTTPKLHQKPFQPAPGKIVPIQSAPNGDSWQREFTHAGRHYKLFKRESTREAPYYVHFQVGRRRYKKSTETNDATTAVVRAKLFIEAVSKERWGALAPVTRAGSVPTVAEVVAEYERRSTLVPRTVRNNVLSLRQVLRTVTGRDEVDGLSVAELSEETARRYQELTARRYASGTDDRREARERALRSSRSTLQQARSLFAHRCLDEYASAGMEIPESVRTFATCRLAGRIAHRGYFQPDDAAIERTFVEVDKLRETDPAAFLAFWLAVGAGLRKGEIAAAQWSHVVTRDGRMWISGGIGKDGERIEVPIQERAEKALATFRRESGKIIPEPGLEWVRRLNLWLRLQGWHGRKKLHELRAYVGSMIYRRDPVAAMRFMRHKSFKVTEQFYVRYGTEARPVDVL